ncbi:uncharacterized protein LOC141907108 [Tubulanus polymorphus]|uniref:uncharacterized protein LOC141907108 n=1 Tax=Tubulanus polymorphus TaxID=672921 RepID=UPI003DA31961
MSSLRKSKSKQRTGGSSEKQQPVRKQQREDSIVLSREDAFKIYDVLTAFKSFKKPEPSSAGVFLIHKTYRARLKIWIKKVRERVKNNEVVKLIHNGMYVSQLAKEFNIVEEKEERTNDDEDEDDDDAVSIESSSSVELDSSDDEFFKELNEQLKKKMTSKTLPNKTPIVRQSAAAAAAAAAAAGGGAGGGGVKAQGVGKTGVKSPAGSKAPLGGVDAEFDLFKAMLGGKDKETGFSIKDMVNGMIKSIYTKEMMQPVSKSVIEKLPAWLAMNGDSLSPDEKTKYKQALVYYKEIAEICDEKIDEKDVKGNEKQAVDLTKVCQKLQGLNVKLPDDIQISVQENADVGAMTENLLAGVFSGVAGAAAGGAGQSGKQQECRLM